MSVSTNAYLCYGIMFDEVDEFPWEKDEFEEIEDWWVYEILQYDDDITHEQYHDILNRNPLPVKLINYCSDTVPMYILAIPGTIKMAMRGDPTEIEMTDLACAEYKRIAFLEFMRKYCDGVENETPRWYLCSFWG